MKVLVTGGAGFIGSNLADNLLKSGYEVKVLDNLSTGRIENISLFKENPSFEFIKGSVSDKPLVEGLMKWCDQCYHLAAPVGVKYIMDNPVLSILENIRGIDVILESAKTNKKRILIASTSEVYGKSLDLLDPTGKRKLNEEDYRVEGATINHRWSYANCKSLDEFLALAYFKEFKLESVVVRFFNTVGPKQLSNYGMVIPNFVEEALAGADVVIYGSGEQMRSFLHVNDAIKAVRLLMDTDKSIGQVFNVGNPFEVTIRSLAETIIKKTGSTSKIRTITYEEAYGPGFEDMNRRTADITKLTKATGFEIEYDLDKILDDIISSKKK